MGRAQVSQAEASGIRANSRYEPNTFKTIGNHRSQVIVRGKSRWRYVILEYHDI